MKGAGLREQITNAERSVYQSSTNWIDFDTFIYRMSWYDRREQILFEQLLSYAREYLRSKLKLNKNIKIL